MNTETTVAVMETQDLELVEREEALSQEVTDIEFQAGAITIAARAEKDGGEENGPEEVR